MIVRTFRIDGNKRYSWTKNQRSLFVSRTRPASLGDSITSSTQIRFSAHTGLCGGPICPGRYPDKAWNRTAAPLVGYKRQDNVLIQTSCHSGHTAFSLP